MLRSRADIAYPRLVTCIFRLTRYARTQPFSTHEATTFVKIFQEPFTDCSDAVARYSISLIMVKLVDLEEETSTEDFLRHRERERAVVDNTRPDPNLSRFAAALSKADISSPNFTATSKHTVTLHNPFVGTLTPNFLDSKNQVRLIPSKYKNIYSSHCLGTPTYAISETPAFIQKLQNRRQGQSRHCKRRIHRDKTRAHSRS